MRDDWGYAEFKKNTRKATGFLRIVEFTNQEGKRQFRIEREVAGRWRKRWKPCKRNEGYFETYWTPEVFPNLKEAKARMAYISDEMLKRKANLALAAIVVASQSSDPDFDEAMREVEKLLKAKRRP